MDRNPTQVERVSPMGKNLPYCLIFLSLPYHLWRLRYERYGRRVGLQLLNSLLERNHSGLRQPQTLCQKIPFLSQNRKLILHHCWLSWKIQVPQWYLLDGCDLIVEKSNYNSQMEVTQSKREYISHKMGPFFNGLRWENLHLWRKIQQWFERYSCRWFGKINHESHEN